MEMAYEISAGAGLFIANAKNNATPDGLMERFFRSLIESAAIAKMIVGLDNNVDAQLLEKELIDTYKLALRKNSSEEGGSVSPMTTARADVSEVKQEELPLGNSSLSRKSGKKPTKKEASSPQKRKIGTKREKSA
jgi:hypothetical protein